MVLGWAYLKSAPIHFPSSTGNHGQDLGFSLPVSIPAPPLSHVPHSNMMIPSACALRKPCATINGKNDHVATRKHLLYVLGDVSHARSTDVSPTESKSVSEILYRLLFPTDITTTDTFPPISLNSIALCANQLPLKPHFIGT